MTHREDDGLVAVVYVVATYESHYAATTDQDHIVRTGEANEAHDAEEATNFVETACSSIALSDHLKKLSDLSA